MEISLDYYRVFYHTARCGSITRAAELLYSNQPNVTRVIKLLESELGCQLFSRTNRGVRLTPEGERLYQRVAAAYEQLLKYPGIMEMPIVSSCYWNNVHGSCPEDVQKDEEGLRTMRVLGRNMAWLLRCIDAGTAAGVPAPRQEPMARTNFIR